MRVLRALRSWFRVETVVDLYQGEQMLRSRKARGLFALALALVVSAAIAASSANATTFVYDFCYGDYYSGQTCTGWSEYHHMDAVSFQATYRSLGQRVCAGLRLGTGQLYGDWKCDYGRVVRYPGGQAGYGTTHDGSPYPMIAVGTIYF
jgi:hypothetical protein